MSKTMEPDLHEPSAGIARPSAQKEWKHPSDHWMRGFILDNRAALGTLAVFIVMMTVFMIANPTVFTTWYLYRSVLTTLPVALFVVVPLVFVVTCGEIDLSFPATMGFASWVFALVVQAGYNPFLGIAAALVTGMLLGFLVGSLVVYGGLSSLIATLGMNFLLRGLIQIINEGKSMALTSLSDSWAYTIFSSQLLGIPVQIFWAIGFVVLSAMLYN
ncbi:ABC transporter permease, partial [Mesorhizobium sp. M7A.F.Ca.CA.004.05.1.1]